MKKKRDWVLVQYAKKKMKRCYVGQLMDTVEGMYKIKFLKAVLGKKIHFIEIDGDEDIISRDMIIKELSNPVKVGTEHRPHYEFPSEDFSNILFG